MAQQPPRASVAGAVNTPAPVVSQPPPAPPPPRQPAAAAPVMTIEDTPPEQLAATAADQEDLFGKIKDGLSNAAGTVAGGTVGVVNKLKDEVTKLKDELEDARGVIDKIGNFFKNFPNMIKDEFEKIIGKIKGVVNEALKPFKAAIEWLSKIKDVWNRFKGWIISVCCTVVLVCSAAILGPFIMPLLSGLSALRSMGNTYAAAVQ